MVAGEAERAYVPDRVLDVDYRPLCAQIKVPFSVNLRDLKEKGAFHFGEEVREFMYKLPDGAVDQIIGKGAASSTVVVTKVTMVGSSNTSPFQWVVRVPTLHKLAAGNVFGRCIMGMQKGDIFVPCDANASASIDMFSHDFKDGEMPSAVDMCVNVASLEKEVMPGGVRAKTVNDSVVYIAHDSTLAKFLQAHRMLDAITPMIMTIANVNVAVYAIDQADYVRMHEALSKYFAEVQSCTIDLNRLYFCAEPLLIGNSVSYKASHSADEIIALAASTIPGKIAKERVAAAMDDLTLSFTVDFIFQMHAIVKK